MALPTLTHPPESSGCRILGKRNLRETILLKETSVPVIADQCFLSCFMPVLPRQRNNKYVCEARMTKCIWNLNHHIVGTKNIFNENIVSIYHMKYYQDNHCTTIGIHRIKVHFQKAGLFNDAKAFLQYYGESRLSLTD